MRQPVDLPRRRVRASRSRAGLVVIAAIAVVVLTSLRGLAGFYTDYLWFQELRLTSVWRGVLGAKVLLAVIFTGIFFGAQWLNLAIADRLAPRFRSVGPEDELVQRYQEVVGPHSGKVRTLVAGVFAFLAGTGVSAQWNNWILFRNSVSFGRRDEQFGQDIAFYVFRLPFLSFIVDWAFVAVVIIAVVTVVAHYLNGGIRLQGPGQQRVTPQVKAHISVLLGVLALIKAADYFLERYLLTFSRRGVVQGATYTDVNVQLPALNLLIFISLAAFVLLLLNIRRQGWVLPSLAIGLWALVSVLAGTLVPAFVQKFQVEPAENARERPYIAQNIKATKEAMGLTEVVQRPFEFRSEITPAELQANSATLSNLRLWDPGTVVTAFQKLQAIRPFYELPDADIDRYEIDGRTTQMNIAVRELAPAGLPRKSWVNRHLEYTHGYGAVLSPANAVAQNGRPELAVQDIPPSGDPAIEFPQVYYGEKTGGYAVVRSRQPEFDYLQADGTPRQSTYEGDGGVAMSSPLRRLAFFLRFNDVNVLVSNLITRESRAIYVRDIGERVRTVAPFLRFDADPYPVVLDGRIKWVQDAYTTSSRYPNAQQADISAVKDGSGLKSSFNYVRNSVKAVVDAYDGNVDFYVVDQEDPIARSYARAFPALFKDGNAVPDGLREHFRYPEDVFQVQSTMFGRYHIEAPDDFYRADNAWNVAPDPEAAAPARATAVTNPVVTPGQPPQTNRRRMAPYYLLMQPPDEEDEQFILLQPYVPNSAGDQQRNLSAFLMAKSDPDGYGELKAFTMPAGQQIDGPSQVAARIESDTKISSEITLLSQAGSEVKRGNLLVIPIERSLLYLRPLYVQATDNQIPELRRVIAVFGNQVAVGATVQEALNLVFPEGGVPGLPETQAPPAQPQPPPPPVVGGGQPVVEVQTLLDQASVAFGEAQNALRQGDLATYQRRNQEGADLVARAQQQLRGQAPPATTPPTSAPSA